MIRSKTTKKKMHEERSLKTAIPGVGAVLVDSGRHIKYIGTPFKAPKILAKVLCRRGYHALMP